MRRAAGAVVVVLVAIGVAAFLIARADAARPDPDADRPSPGGTVPAHTFVVDGRAYSCLSAGTVFLRAEVSGVPRAEFVVDGAEVASARSIGGTGDDVVPMAEAMMPGPAVAIRCADHGVHRVDVYTDHPEGCALSAQPYATFTEARSHELFDNTAQGRPGVCSLTIRY